MVRESIHVQGIIVPTSQTPEGTLEKRIEQYRTTAREIRKDILDMTYAAQSGHIGGSLSAVEFLVWLYSEELEISPEDPSARALSAASAALGARALSAR